jgi:hypothetical protein
MIQMERPADLVARIKKFSALADRREASVPPEILRRYTGDYKFGERTISISSAHGRLWLRLPDLPVKPLFASSANRFFVRTTETEFEFGRDTLTNSPELVIYNAGGGTIRCPRL